MYFGRTSGSDWIFPARTSDSSDCNGYICCDNGTVVVCSALTGIMTLYGFTMLLLVLLVPYIFHYYTLENETQKNVCTVR